MAPIRQKAPVIIESPLFPIGEYTIEKPTVAEQIPEVAGFATSQFVQLILPGTEKQKLPNVAFGRFVKPELYDVFGDQNFDTLTPHEKSWNPQAALERALHKPFRSIKLGTIDKKDQLIVDGYGFNAYEYNLLLRSPNAMARKAVSHVLGDNEITDTKLAAAKRGVGHVLDKHIAPMQEHLDKLVVARVEVQELGKEIKTPGFAHHDETWMKQRLSTVWKEFQTMLDVMHVQRGWDDGKRQSAQAALLFYLTQGKQSERVKRWDGMTTLAENYLAKRINTFGRRIEKANAKLPVGQSGQVAS